MRKLLLLFLLLPSIGFSQLRFKSGVTWDNLGTLYVITYDDIKGKGKGSFIYRDKSFIDSAIYVLENNTYYYFDGGFLAQFSKDELYLSYNERITLITRKELQEIKEND